MNVLVTSVEFPESWEERRRLRQRAQDVLDEAEYRVLVGGWRPGDPEPVGVIHSLRPLPPPQAPKTRMLDR